MLAMSGSSKVMSNEDRLRTCCDWCIDDAWWIVEWNEAVRGEDGVGDEGAIGIAAYSNVDSFGGTGGGGFMPKTIALVRSKR